VGKKTARGVVKRFCAKADCVIVPSRFTRDALRNADVKSRFAVVPSGILGPNILPGARERVRAQLGLAAETPLILCLGRLGPEKRVDLLLQAVSVLVNDCGLPSPISDFRVALVGDGQCRADLEQLSADLGLQERVMFLGAQPHASIGDWYAAADI